MGWTAKPPKPILIQDLDGSYWHIPLTKGLFAKVSDEDVERVSKYKWTASYGSRSTKYYAIRRAVISGKSTCIRMHHFIVDQPPGTLFGDRVVDHVNHDSLDNRRENLEIISQAENMKRSPGWKKKPEEVSL